MSICEPAVCRFAGKLYVQRLGFFGARAVMAFEILVEGVEAGVCEEMA
jgi:hypothetical protein